MVLDGSLKSLEVVLAGGVATAQPVFYAAYADHTLTTFVPGASDGLTNGATAVTAVAAPTSGIQRQIKLFSLFNNDTAVVTATVRINNNAVMRIVVKITLAIGDTLEYDPSNGWKVITAAGVVKSGISPAGATGEVQYNAGGGSLGASPNLAWSIANNQLLFGNGTAANPSWAFVNSPGAGIFRQAADALGIVTAGIERMRVSAGGGVAIGDININPNSKSIHQMIQDATGFTLFEVSSATGSHRPVMLGRRSRGSLASPSGILAGDLMFDFSSQGHDGTAFGDGALFRFEAAENWGAAARGVNLDIFVGRVGTTAVTRRYRISGSGTHTFYSDAAAALIDILNDGKPNFQASPTQTTVGAAGGASALPATPTGYLRIQVAGAERVIPFYAQA